MQADVELREVESEDLDAPTEIGETSVGDPGSPIRPEAAVDDGQIGGELVRRAVTAVSEPPPDEGELAPVGLALVLRTDQRRVVRELLLIARDRLEELVRDRGERARDPDRRGQPAHLCSIAREHE